MCGAVFDLLTHRVPNWLIIIGTLTGFFLVSATGPAASIYYVLCIVGVIILGFPLFLCRMIGAGDLKLMAMICGYLGMGHGLLIIFYGFLLGAVISFAKLYSYGCFARRLLYLIQYLDQLFKTKKIVSYYNIMSEGYGMTIPLAACLFFGSFADIIVNLLGGIT